MNLTAGYNADVARVYGINEALLLDSIEFWMRNSRRKDGYCWFTADEFEVKTAVKRGAMERAVKKLEKLGIIETKNTYIIGTHKKCKHYKIVGDVKSECSETTQSDCIETTQSESTETIQSVNSSDRTLTELSLSNDKGGEPQQYGNDDINEVFKYWQQVVGYEISGQVQSNRRACYNLIRKYTLSGVKQLIDGVAMTQGDKYAPRIANIAQLQAKQNDLMAWGKTRMAQSQQNQQNTIPQI